MKSLRVTGVYSSETIFQLYDQNITDIGFDLRPRSFNFIQIAGIEKMLQEVSATSLNYYLRFENEKDFVVKELMQKVQKTGAVIGQNIWAEYYGDESIDDCKSIGIPYFKLLKDKNFRPWIEDPNLRGIVLNETFLNTLGMHSDILSFLSEFFQQVPKSVKVDLSLEWCSEISRSIVEFYPFNNLCFQIDSNVEISYRNVNLQLIKQHIEHTQRLLSDI